ncbi:hypothetical protein METBIDRAFT_37876 [Metschnikowia bicuspidata var. bicuspidata NRRL YB-4993]|uniref:Co-chaperone HscB C-terminal oligomerisation domain-containing protein n=1 Tax=Metschnikowia bicuspidata var. bicuspidata NRRL YB-4993 TaxID=869754 RepID=A0A1A0HJF1_9ASCO|nr:hypothetical protein METBIDRAFT_37876 [Metschnikowia bicuspidata var. bicuspidata NRRL YB-4993]OBA24126.1 hypothetical protein METBIDRAFT_37876 [Metschnikowia bicuspidata var. bicuspidata NRRL YB-4993]
MHTQDTLFRLFPKLFPAGGPPKDPFQVNLRLLRREYRALQGQNHPDVVMGAAGFGPNTTAGSVNDGASSAINHAYATLRNPYTRAAYIVELQHPEKLDITKDDVLKQFIANVQAASQEHSLDYKALLMTVLEAHEALESATSEADLAALEEENTARIEQSEQSLDALLKQTPVPWEAFIIETIELKYWVNIANGIKDWEPGKPVLLTH